jgi:hypothetical protein
MYIFHMSSILITTCLCIQKAIVLKYPLWGKRHLNKKSSVLIIIVVITCILVFNIPNTVHGIFGIYRGENDKCCHSGKQMYKQRVKQSVIAKTAKKIVTGERYLRCKNTITRNVLNNSIIPVITMFVCIFHKSGTK